MHKILLNVVKNILYTVTWCKNEENMSYFIVFSLSKLNPKYV